ASPPKRLEGETGCPLDGGPGPPPQRPQRRPRRGGCRRQVVHVRVPLQDLEVNLPTRAWGRARQLRKTVERGVFARRRARSERRRDAAHAAQRHGRALVVRARRVRAAVGPRRGRERSHGEVGRPHRQKVAPVLATRRCRGHARLGQRQGRR
ncbi:hypothetical protein M885DRAFT_623973, partial [Pelagophyceae sp. CCMP2097]